MPTGAGEGLSPDRRVRSGPYTPCTNTASIHRCSSSSACSDWVSEEAIQSVPSPGTRVKDNGGGSETGLIHGRIGVSHRYPTGTDEHETRVPSPVPGDPGRKPRMGSGDGSEVSTRRSLVLAIRVSEANEPGSSGNWQASGPKSYLRRLPLYPSELRAHQADFTRVPECR
jgi:hypothetical protein